MSTSLPSRVGRRKLLAGFGAVAGTTVVSGLLAACGQAATPTTAPTKPAAEPTKPAAAAPAPTTAPAAAATKPAAAAATPAAAKPAATTAAGSSASATVNIKVGLVTPLSGDVKTFGESTKNGFTIASEEAKAKGVNITPVIADDRNDPTEGSNSASKLIEQDKVKAIVGSVSSKVSIPVSEVAQSSKIVMITPTSTNPKVTVADGKRKDYIFRACFIDPFQGTVMAKFAADNLKAKKAAVLYDVSNDYSKGLAEYFRDSFQKSGGTVGVFESYGTTDVDFSALLTKVAADGPQVVFLPDYYNKVNLIAKQAQDKSITATLLGGDGWDSSDLDVKATEGGYFSNHYSADDTRPEVQAWVSKYKSQFNAVPDALATLAYDATNILVEAVKQAGSDDDDKIRDAMAKMKDFQTVSGKISFDENGDPIKSAVVLQIKGGKQTFVTTVNP